VRNRSLIYAIFILAFTGLYVPKSYSQKPTYTCTLTNDVLTSENVYEFDIYLLRTGTDPFEFSGIEFGIFYNDQIKNGGTLTVSYVPGSTDEAIVTSGQQNKVFNTATPGLIKIAAKLAPGRHGTGAIISGQAPGTRVGRLRLTNSVPFSPLKPDITLNFNNKPYATLIGAYVGVINTDITDPKNFIIALRNPVLSGTDSEKELPKNFELNLYHASPSTTNATVSYTLPNESDVKLLVYNSIGEKVRELVNSIQKAGYYEVTFDAKTLPDGVYFFTIKASSKSGTNKFIKTKKMVYLK